MATPNPLSVTVYDREGKESGQVELPEAVFNAPVNEAVLHQAVLRQHANERQGTHQTKTRGEVSGGGKKPWKQKGTGRARQGSTRAPQWRHGGVSSARTRAATSRRCRASSGGSRCARRFP